MVLTEEIKVELIEKELIKVEAVDKELIKIELSTIDVLYSHPSLSIDNLILNETPVNVTSLPSKRFKTAYPFVSGKIQIFLNGMKIHNSEIIFHSDTEFSYPLDIIDTDKVEVVYIKKE